MRRCAETSLWLQQFSLTTTTIVSRNYTPQTVVCARRVFKQSSSLRKLIGGFRLIRHFHADDKQLMTKSLNDDIVNTARPTRGLGQRDTVTPSLRGLHWLFLEQRIILCACNLQDIRDSQNPQRGLKTSFLTVFVLFETLYCYALLHKWFKRPFRKLNSELDGIGNPSKTLEDSKVQCEQGSNK
jgi:hypothetical protein